MTATAPWWEAWRGAAKGFEDVVLLTLGTGSEAVLLNGALFTGQRRRC